jgi:hypothetical protein
MMNSPSTNKIGERKSQNTTAAKPTRLRCSVSNLMSEVGLRIDKPYNDNVSTTAVISVDGCTDFLMGCVIN